MAMMDDFARLPGRQKVMVFAIIGIILGLVYWKIVYKKLDERYAEVDAEHNAKSSQNKQLEKDIPEFEKLKAQMGPLQRLIDENQRALPTEAELPAFFETLNRKVLESGVEVIRSSQDREQPVERFVKVPINYEIQGTFVQIKKFFASLLPKNPFTGHIRFR